MRKPSATTNQSGICRMNQIVVALVIGLAALDHDSSEAHHIQELRIDGDILVGGLFPVHRRGKSAENQCDEIDPQPGYQYLTAMVFALKEINNSTTILPNITLGAKIYDTCRSQTIGVDRAKDFIKYTLQDESNSKPLAGVVGAFRSDVSLAVANLLRVFDIPQVSFGSTTPELSDKSIYGNFLRTVPSNAFQSKAMVDVVKHFNWKYVMTVFSPGDYGEKGMEIFYAEAEKAGICIANKIRLPSFPKEDDYKQVVKKLLEMRTKKNGWKVDVVVLFCIQRDNRGLVKAASQLFEKNNRFTWVASNSWGRRVDVTNENEEAGEGAITVDFVGEEVKNFRNYFTNLKPQNMNHSIYPWFEEFWQAKLQCRLQNAHIKSDVSKNCTGDEALAKNLTIVPVRVVINSLFAIAHALENMRKSLCGESSGMCLSMRNMTGKLLLEFLQNATFPDAALNETVKFNKNHEVNGHYNVINFKRYPNGKYQYDVVGTWRGMLVADGSVVGSLTIDEKQVSWATSETPESFCSKPCKLGQVKEEQVENPKCCWICKDCKKNHIIRNNTCFACPNGYRTDTNLSHCIQLPVRYPTAADLTGGFLAFLSSFGILGTICTAVFFIKFKEHAVIKAAGRELSSIMFVGLALCYIAAILWLVKPSPANCAARRFISSISLTACYAPILLRTTRIYRIFTAAKKTVRRPAFISPKAQIVSAACIIGVQIFIAAIWFLARPPGVQHVYSHDHYVLLECHAVGSHVVVYLAYNILLLLAIAVLAFKTRTYPRNFNEAKYIAVTAYLCCSVWVIIFPCYLNIGDSFVKAYLASTSLLLVASIILCGLLVSKIFLVRNKDSESAGSVTMPSSTGLGTRSEDYTLEQTYAARAKKCLNQATQCNITT